VHVKPGDLLFSQGEPAESIFFLEDCRAKLSVLSERGTEATVRLAFPGDFIGEESLARRGQVHTASGSAVTSGTVLKLYGEEMAALLHEQHEFSESFLNYLVLRGVRAQEDQIDQLLNNSEKRLARTLLVLAEFGQPGEIPGVPPAITQVTLAEMIGTTRSRVSFFMNRFRRLGYITYKGRIKIHKALLNGVLNDRLPERRINPPAVLKNSQSDRKPI